MLVDAVLGGGGFVLAAALLPSFRYGQRPSKNTSAICALVMLAFTVCYAVTGYTIASFSSALNFGLWHALLFLKVNE